MAVQLKKRVPSDVAAPPFDHRYANANARLTNNTGTALTTVLAASNGTLRDMLGYPLGPGAASGLYTILTAGQEATAVALLIYGPRNGHDLLDPADAAASLANGANTTEYWTVIDKWAGIILRFTFHPVNDVLNAAFDAAALRTRFDALGARVLDEAPQTERQAT